MKKLIKFNTFLASHWRSAFSFDFISVFHEESLRSGYWIRTIVLNGDSTRVIDPASRTKASSIWCFLYGRRAHVAFERWRRSDSEFSVTFDILQSKKEKKKTEFCNIRKTSVLLRNNLPTKWPANYLSLW